MTVLASTAVASTEYASSDHYNNLRTDMINSDNDLSTAMVNSDNDLSTAILSRLALVCDTIKMTVGGSGASPSLAATPPITGGIAFWAKGLAAQPRYLAQYSDQALTAYFGHRNIMSGLTGSITEDFTNLTNIANACDESLSSVSGEGYREGAATADDITYVQWDLGSSVTGLAGVLASFYTSGGNTASLRLKSSVNGTAFTALDTRTNSLVSTRVWHTIAAPFTGRYLRLSLWSSGTAAVYITIAEVFSMLEYMGTAATAGQSYSTSMTATTAGTGETDLYAALVIPATAPAQYYLSIM